MFGAEGFVKGFQFVLADFSALKGKGKVGVPGIVKTIRRPFVWENRKTCWREEMKGL